MRDDTAEIPRRDPVAYFLTWTTYGTWLPGDERGWVAKPGQFRAPDLHLQAVSRALLTEEPCVLDSQQRSLVEKTIAQHCSLRGWRLHAVNCRTNHVHVVVTASVHPQIVRDQLKAWCTRKLKELQQSSNPAHPKRLKWWSQGGSNRWLNDDESLLGATQYVQDCQ